MYGFEQYFIDVLSCYRLSQQCQAKEAWTSDKCTLWELITLLTCCVLKNVCLCALGINSAFTPGSFDSAVDLGFFFNLGLAFSQLKTQVNTLNSGV